MYYRQKCTGRKNHVKVLKENADEAKQYWLEQNIGNKYYEMKKAWIWYDRNKIIKISILIVYKALGPIVFWKPNAFKACVSWILLEGKLITSRSEFLLC